MTLIFYFILTTVGRVKSSRGTRWHRIHGDDNIPTSRDHKIDREMRSPQNGKKQFISHFDSPVNIFEKYLEYYPNISRNIYSTHWSMSSFRRVFETFKKYLHSKKRDPDISTWKFIKKNTIKRFIVTVNGYHRFDWSKSSVPYYI